MKDGLVQATSGTKQKLRGGSSSIYECVVSGKSDDLKAVFVAPEEALDCAKVEWMETRVMEPDTLSCY